MPTKPAVVGFLRGVLEGVLIAALGVLVAAVSELDFGEWNIVLPVVLLGARTVEGIIDHKVDPTRQRGRLGGGPVSE